MISKTIKYVDYNGEERVEDFYFNLTPAEMSEMSLSVNGGLEKFLVDMLQKQDTMETFKWFKAFILKAYGEKSLDGKYFMKSEEISHRFECCPAYNVLFMEITENAESASKFFNSVIPEVPEDKKLEAQARVSQMLHKDI